MKRYLVDSYLRTRDRKWLHAMHDPVRQQKRFFTRLRASLSGTLLDRAIHISKFKSLEEYIRETPPRDFSFFEQYVNRALSGQADIMFRGKTAHALYSSGTTGKSKCIPCSEAHLRQIKGFQGDMAAAMIGYIPGFSGFVRRINIGNYGNFENPGSVTTSYISGLFNEAVPTILRKTTWPDCATLKIPEWDARVRCILDQTIHEQIGMLSGTAPTVLNFIKTVCGIQGISRITDLWPSLDSIVYTGNEIGRLRDTIDRYFERAPCYFGSYMATEGVLGFQDVTSDGADPLYRLAFDRNVFSFKRRMSGESALLAADELEHGREYEVLISNHTGLAQYELGDVLRVEGNYPDQRFKILGRDKVLLNVAGERLCDAHILEAFAGFRKKCGSSIDIGFFFVFPETLNDGRFRYCFMVLTRGKTVDEKHARLLDLEIQGISIVYKDLRKVGIIEKASLESAPERVAETYARKTVGGNAKIKYCFASRREFLDFYR